jgi:hypothetical protein
MGFMSFPSFLIFFKERVPASAVFPELPLISFDGQQSGCVVEGTVVSNVQQNPFSVMAGFGLGVAFPVFPTAGEDRFSLRPFFRAKTITREKRPLSGSGAEGPALFVPQGPAVLLPAKSHSGENTPG